MRALYVLHQFFPKYVSGTEQFVLALARAGRARGDDVRVFALDPDFRDPAPVGTETFEWEGVPTTIHSFDKAMPNWILEDYEAPAREESFERVLDEFRPEIVHVFHLRWLGVDRLEQLQRCGIPFVAHVMDFWFVCPNFLLLHRDGSNCDGPPRDGAGCLDCMWPDLTERLRASDALDDVLARAATGEFAAHVSNDADLALAGVQRLTRIRSALRLARKVYAPSRVVEDRLRANGHELREIEHVPYALDRTRFGEVTAAPSGPITVGFLGTFAPHKGLDLLLRGFRSIDDADIRLDVHGRFGDVPDYDLELRRLADGDERIRFAGPFGREELGGVLAGLDVVVVPSRWRENTPFVCLEARACGIRLLVADLEGMTEALPEGRGRAFDADSWQSLGRELGILIDEIRAGARRLDRDPSIAEIGAQYERFRADYARFSGC